jgi:hypothetical protein
MCHSFLLYSWCTKALKTRPPRRRRPDTPDVRSNDYVSRDLPGITTASQLGHQKAGMDETTGDEAKLPSTRSPEEYALQNARRHPRGFVRCQMAPEQ